MYDRNAAYEDALRKDEERRQLRKNRRMEQYRQSLEEPLDQISPEMVSDDMCHLYDHSDNDTNESEFQSLPGSTSGSFDLETLDLPERVLPVSEEASLADPTDVTEMQEPARKPAKRLTKTGRRKAHRRWGRASSKRKRADMAKNRMAVLNTPNVQSAAFQCSVISSQVS